MAAVRALAPIPPGVQPGRVPALAAPLRAAPDERSVGEHQGLPPRGQGLAIWRRVVLAGWGDGVPDGGAGLPGDQIIELVTAVGEWESGRSAASRDLLDRVLQQRLSQLGGLEGSALGCRQCVVAVASESAMGRREFGDIRRGRGTCPGRCLQRPGDVPGVS